jgi:hypothetical protein
VADDQNSARVVVAVAKGLPADWPPSKLVTIPPHGQLLDQETAQHLKAGLDWHRATIQQARTLAQRPAGRHRLDLTSDYPELGEQRDQTNSFRVATLLQLDALERAQNNDPKGALVSCEAALNASRSIGDEPVLDNQLRRSFSVEATVAVLDRILGLGEAPGEALQRVQRLLAEEERQPIVPWAWRGERALMHRLFERMKAGQTSVGQARRAVLSRREGWEPYLYSPCWHSLPGEHLLTMQWLAEAVAIARLPEHERIAREKELWQTVWRQAWRTRLAGGRLHGPFVNQNFRYWMAALRTMQALLAVERYRQQHRAWPADLARLVPQFLPAVPLDPYDGKPIRYRVTPESATVYVVRDGVDHGGKLSPLLELRPFLFHERDCDLGCRLVKATLRRQPSPGKPEVPE